PSVRLLNKNIKSSTMAILNDVETEKTPQPEITSPSASNRDVGNVTSPMNVQEQPKRSWKSYIWDTFDKSPEERRFLFKLDLALMTLASLGYFIKYLDQASLNLELLSKQTLTCSQGQHQQRIRIRHEGGSPTIRQRTELYADVLDCRLCHRGAAEQPTFDPNPPPLLDPLLRGELHPSLRGKCPIIPLTYIQVTWSVLTILLIKCNTPTQIYVLRFFIGLAESTFYPGMQYIIGSWYRKDELAKRSCLFHAMGNVGSMVSGYLMAGSHNLNGVNGWHGWQSLFITNTVVSLPIALAGFFFLPDIPEITTAWYFTPDEIALAKRRMELEGRATRQPFTKKKVASIFSTWHIYMLVLLYIVFNNGNGGNSQPAFQLWLKSEHYDVRAVNLYPTLTEVISIVTTLIYAWTSDTIFHGARWPPIVFSGLVKILAYGGLTAWAIPNGFKWACFLMCGFGGGISGLAFAWAHEICNDDTEKRAIVTGSMNMMAYVFQAWLPLLIWQQVEAPRYPKGYSTTLGLAILLIAIAMAIRFLHKREIGLKGSLDKVPV
ncbi:major facilitator superfamily transporter, partial [Apiospora marii]|uniref:major facilitator superfamily transporter n=1 Tax=Apiospora marii TaxID=335849 RepID=UPI00312F7347